MADIAPERLVFLDESAALTNLVRRHAWSRRGARAAGVAPCGHWQRVTILGALGHTGIVGAMSIPAATDGAVFQARLEQVLLPELRRVEPAAVLVMDNLAAHKTPAVRALLDASGFTCHGPWPRAGPAGPGAPALLPGPEPDRARLGQSEGSPAPSRGADGRGAARRARPGTGRHHAPRCPSLVPPCRLRPSQLTCGLL
jgi:hypothetical protein